MRELTHPKHLFARQEVLAKPSPIPAMAGLYAWFFREIPNRVPTASCITYQGKTLLYIGISPDKGGKPNSKQNLRTRIATHFTGNAAGSTLRRTLGVLRTVETGFPLRRVGSGKRMTFTHLGEQNLDRWMAENAFVAWVEHPSPWEIEHQLLKLICCPLNIMDNAHHPFAVELKLLRKAAITEARNAQIAREDNMARKLQLFGKEG